jgi:F-type H+-transporting ATPase subunit b
MEQIITDPSSIFYFDLGVFIWAFITFGVMLIVLWKAAWIPILKALEKREQIVEENLVSAQEEKEKVVKLKTKEESVLAEAHDKATEIIRERREEAKKKAEELVNARRNRIEQERKEVRQQMVEAKAKAKDNFRTDVGNLALEMLRKMKISKDLKPSDELLERVIKKYPFD